MSDIQIAKITRCPFGRILISADADNGMHPEIELWPNHVGYSFICALLEALGYAADRGSSEPRIVNLPPNFFEKRVAAQDYRI